MALRLWWMATGIGLMMMGGAQASSFVTIAPPAANDTPSFVVFGDWKPDEEAAQAQSASIQQFGLPTPDPNSNALSDIPLAFPLPESREAAMPTIVLISPSIVAFDPPAPSVTFEQVAAIPKPTPSPRDTTAEPIVIRGGIVGGASVAAAPVALPEQVTEQPGAETKVNAAGKRVVVINAAPDPAKNGPSQPATVEIKVATPPREFAKPE